MDQSGKTKESQQYQMLKSDFITLEEKFVKWFHEKGTFIEDYFIDRDFSNDFVENCDLPDEIKKEALVIKAKYRESL
jgi:hypothetical protein